MLEAASCPVRTSYRDASQPVSPDICPTGRFSRFSRSKILANRTYGASGTPRLTQWYRLLERSRRRIKLPNGAGMATFFNEFFGGGRQGG